MVSRFIYQLAAVTLATSIVWAAMGVYSAVRDPAEISVDPEVLKPLTPTIDEEVIAELERRRGITDAEFEALVSLVERQITEREREAVGGRAAESEPASVQELVVEEEDEVATGAAVAQP